MEELTGKRKKMDYKSNTREVSGEKIVCCIKDNPTFGEQVPRWHGSDDIIEDKNKFAVYKNDILIGKRKKMKEAENLYKQIFPRKKYRTNDLDKRLYHTEFFINATSNEKTNFYFENKAKNHVEWDTDNSGKGYQVGSVKSGKETLPVVVTFMFAKWNGVQVCFYESDSRGCDWTMIEEFIENHFPVRYDNGTRTAMTNSDNFHHAIHFCQERKELQQITI
jgi:hypothetical protein